MNKEVISEIRHIHEEYDANLIFAYKWYKRELVEDSERNPMHIAWRTRGDLLETAEVENRLQIGKHTV